MHYLIYKISNKINGKIYIGQHKTTDLNDRYFGSGVELSADKDLYGIENFEKEILYEFDNFADMNDKEIELVTEDFIERTDTYNLKLGGQSPITLLDMLSYSFRYLKFENLSQLDIQNGIFNEESEFDKDLKVLNKIIEVCDNAKDQYEYDFYLEFYERFLNDERVSDIANELNVSHMTIYRKFKKYFDFDKLKEENLRTKRLNEKLDIIEKVSEKVSEKEKKEKLFYNLFYRYINGEKVVDLAKEAGYSKMTIYRKFKQLEKYA